MGKSGGSNLTISDIARIAKVSTTTVSRYLNGKYEYMSADTQETIRFAIEKSGYRPNQVARSLKTKKSNLISVVCPGIAVQSSPLFLQGVDNVLRNSGYDYMILSSGDDFNGECSCLDRCIDQQVDGILYSPTSENFEKAMSMAQEGIPIVLFDRYHTSWPYSSVYIDHGGLIRNTLDHLLQNGYDEVSLLTGTYSSVDTRHLREEAFCAYMQERCQDAQAVRILRFERGSHMNQSIENILRDYLKEPNTGRRAILAVDMQSLHTVLRLINKMSIKIPRDFAICGYDSLDWSNLFSPSVTYLEQPLFEMGCEASRMLLGLISGDTGVQKTMCIRGALRIGESTMKI